MGRFSKSSTRNLLFSAVLIVPLAMSTQPVVAQAPTGSAWRSSRALPAAAERALSDTNKASFTNLDEVERAWRETFRRARSRDRLTNFVGETLSLFEKVLQVRDMAIDPRATDARVRELFRKRIMNADIVCSLFDETLSNYCKALDEQDQALFIELKIDREAGRTALSRSIIDPESFKGPINEAATSAVAAAQNDLARSVANFAASEAIGAGMKRAARDLGFNRTKEGSAADFVTGLLIDIGVGMAVDAATDPTPKMVANLENRLQQAERAILDGSSKSSGFITTLRQITKDRVAARRKLIEAELLK